MYAAIQTPVKLVEYDDYTTYEMRSFIFNLGSGAFRNSTLIKLLNKGDYEGAAKQFARWNKAGGVVLPGLVRRRDAEKRLFEA